MEARKVMEEKYYHLIGHLASTYPDTFGDPFHFSLDRYVFACKIVQVWVTIYVARW